MFNFIFLLQTYFSLQLSGAFAQDFVAHSVTGEVEVRTVDQGSKSERKVLGIEDEVYGFLIIRLKGDNAFVPGSELNLMLGKRVRCEGILMLPSQLIKAQCEELPADCGQNLAKESFE